MIYDSYAHRFADIPDAFLRAVTPLPLPPEGGYGVGLAFLPDEGAEADRTRGEVEKIAVDEGLRIVGWRQVPTDDSTIGPTARFPRLPGRGRA